MGEARQPDLRAFAKAVRFRDRAVKAALAHQQRVGLTPSSHYARATFDAIADLIREDERDRLAADRLADADLRERFAALAVIEEYIGESCDNASHNIREVLKGDDPRPNADQWGLDYRALTETKEK